MPGYVFRPPNQSLCEKICLHRFWNLIVTKLYPTWLTPNAITLAGGACVFLMLVVLLQGQLAAEDDGPLASTRCGLLAFLIFAYQTLDGTDGMQARRLLQSSAQGELLDHTVDSLAVSVIPFAVAASAGAVFGAVDLFLIQGAFLSNNLCLLVRGDQTYGFVDAQEGLLAAVGFLAAATFGFTVPYPRTALLLLYSWNILGNMKRLTGLFTSHLALPWLSMFATHVVVGLYSYTLLPSNRGKLVWVVVHMLMFANNISAMLASRHFRVGIRINDQDFFKSDSLRITFGLLLATQVKVEHWWVSAIVLTVVWFVTRFHTTWQRILLPPR